MKKFLAKLQGTRENSPSNKEESFWERNDHTRIGVFITGYYTCGKTHLLTCLKTRATSTQCGLGFSDTMGLHYGKNNFGTNCQFEFTKMPAQEEFTSLIEQEIKETGDIILLCYSLDFPNLDNTRKYFRNHIEQKMLPHSRLIVVGAKSDTPNRLISLDQGRAFADEIGAQFIETSAFKYEGIEELIAMILEIAGLAIEH